MPVFYISKKGNITNKESTENQLPDSNYLKDLKLTYGISPNSGQIEKRNGRVLTAEEILHMSPEEIAACGGRTTKTFAQAMLAIRNGESLTGKK